MRRGEVWEYTIGRDRLRVLVISSDGYNEDPRANPVCVDLIRRIPGVMSPLLVPLADPDPVGGMVDLTSVRPSDRARMSGPVGMLTGGTMAKVNAAVVAFLAE